MAVPHAARTWQTGDTITATALNLLENDLAAAGVSSVTATALAAGATPTASISNGLLTLGIPAGATGAAGAAGAAAALTIGTVGTLAAGAGATATITGSAPNYVLNLGIPQGAAGSGSGSTGAAVLQWQPNTAYSAGQIVINPAGQTVQAVSGFTSASSYSASNWTVLSVILLTANTMTAAGTMVAGRPNLLDATNGAFTATLPTPAFVGQEIELERVDTTANLITIGGTVRGAASQITLLGQGVIGESMSLYAETLTSWRIAASHKPNAYLRTVLQEKWLPNTAYAAGAVVVNPSGVLVSAKVAFTSGATYSASDWTATTTSSGTAAADSIGASDYGLVAVTDRPILYGAATAVTSGYLFVMRGKAAVAATASGFVVPLTTVGTSITLAKCAVYDSTGAQLGVTADASSTFMGTTGDKSIPFTAPTRTLVRGEDLYFAMLVVFTGTAPQTRTVSSAGSINFNGRTGATYVSAGIASLSDVPATLAFASLTNSNVPRLFGLAS